MRKWKMGTTRCTQLGITVLVAVGILLLMAGCGKHQTQPDKVSVTLPMVALPYWNAVYVAIEKGYYAAQNLDVTVEYSSEGSLGVIKQVATGHSQFGIATGDAVIKARTQGLPIVAVYQSGHENSYSLITQTDLPSLKSLEGGTIAITGAGSPTELTPKGILRHAGVDLSKITFTPVGTAVVQSFLQHQVDAFGAAIDHELALEAQGAQFKVWRGKDYGANYVTLCVVTSDEMKKNSDLVKRFLEATHYGYWYSAQNPKDATDIYINKYNPAAKANSAPQYAIWDRVLQYDIKPTSYSLGSIDRAQWQATIDDLLAIGAIAQRPDIRQVIDSTWYDKYIKALPWPPKGVK